MRVVLDTNVVVSGYLSEHGVPAKILGLWKNQVFDLLVSETILTEYSRVLRYDHLVALHHLSDTQVRELLDQFREFAIVIDSVPELVHVSVDKDDDKFIACAIAGSAEYVVSGDPDLLNVGHYAGIQILTPNAFVTLLTTEDVA